MLILSLVATPGCEDKRRHQSSEQVEFPAVTPPVGPTAGPGETAAALARAMASLQTIRAHGFATPGNKEKYDNAMGLIASLMDKEAVFENVRIDRSPTVPRDVSRDAAVRLIAESWVSTMAHYAGGLHADSPEVTLFAKGETVRGKTRRLRPDGAIEVVDSRTRQTEEAIVKIDAENPRERELLARIEADPSLRGAANQSGEPIFDAAKVRDRAIAEGFNVPIGVRISIRLNHKPEGWRAVQLWLEGPGPIQPTTAPAPRAAS